MDWLKTELLSSEARFKVIINSVPIISHNTFAGNWGGMQGGGMFY